MWIAEPMDPQEKRHVDPQLSQAETLAGDASAFPEFPADLRVKVVPEFPVKDWDR